MASSPAYTWAVSRPIWSSNFCFSDSVQPFYIDKINTKVTSIANYDEHNSLYNTELEPFEPKLGLLVAFAHHNKLFKSELLFD